MYRNYKSGNALLGVYFQSELCWKNSSAVGNYNQVALRTDCRHIRHQEVTMIVYLICLHLPTNFANLNCLNMYYICTWTN